MPGSDVSLPKMSCSACRKRNPASQRQRDAVMLACANSCHAAGDAPLLDLRGTLDVAELRKIWQKAVNGQTAIKKKGKDVNRGLRQRRNDFGWEMSRRRGKWKKAAAGQLDPMGVWRVFPLNCQATRQQQAAPGPGLASSWTGTA